MIANILRTCSQPSLLLAYFPGLALVALIVLAALALGSWLGNAIIWALLIGMALAAVVRVPDTALPGVGVSASLVLRIGVALLGFQVTGGAFVALGASASVLLMVAVFGVIAAGAGLGPMLGLNRNVSIVLAAAVAICGASAAAAFALVLLSSQEDRKRDLACAIGVISLFSTAAMAVYPALVHGLGFNAAAAGFVLGGSIHEVAHAVGAGYGIGDAAGVAATVTKMLRVALLAPALMLVDILVRSGQGRTVVPKPPAFLVLFVLFALAATMGFVPASLTSVALPVSRFCILMAMAAIGLMLPWRTLLAYGWRPVLLIAILSLGLLVFVTLVAAVLFS
jgi:uncharacterized integral membrane protein (TIGR00698 family)